jgi:hypothetical protein
MTINRNKVKKTGLNPSLNNCKANSDKKYFKSEKKYCLFYNRYGRCSRGDSCQYIHDPNHVALCPRSKTLFINVNLKKNFY